MRLFQPCRGLVPKTRKKRNKALTSSRHSSSTNPQTFPAQLDILVMLRSTCARRTLPSITRPSPIQPLRQLITTNNGRPSSYSAPKNHFSTMSDPTIASLLSYTPQNPSKRNPKRSTERHPPKTKSNDSCKKTISGTGGSSCTAAPIKAIPTGPFLCVDISTQSDRNWRE